MNHGHVVVLAVVLGAALSACEGGGEEPAGDAPQGANGEASVGSAAPANVPPRFDDPVGRMPGLLPEPPEIENPYEGDVDALREGRRLFVAYNCYGCHGGHGGGGMGPSLRDDTWIYGERGIDIYDSIAKGRPHSMPAWEASLPPGILWRITAYIQSMRTDEEPEPPPRNRSLEGGGQESGSGSEGAPSEPV